MSVLAGLARLHRRWQAVKNLPSGLNGKPAAITNKWTSALLRIMALALLNRETTMENNIEPVHLKDISTLVSLLTVLLLVAFLWFGFHFGIDQGPMPRLTQLPSFPAV